MKIFGGKIEESDLQYIWKTYGVMPTAASPAPRRKGRHTDVTRFLLKDGTLIDLFHVQPIYYLHLNGEYRPLSEITYGFGNTWANLKENWQENADPRWLRWYMKRVKVSVPYIAYLPVLATTTDFFPNSPGNAAGRDGWSARVATGSTFANLRSGAGTHTGTASPVEAFDILSDAAGSTWKQMRTGFFLFDTSAIGAGQTVTAATFGLVGTAASATFSQSAVMVDSNPANPIAASDFEGRLGVEQATARIAASSWNTDGTTYNTFTLNATGQGNISLTGTSKFGIRGSGDEDNAEPTWSANGNGNVTAKYADTAGTSADPKLTVTYSKAGGVMPTLLILGVA